MDEHSEFEDNKANFVTDKVGSLIEKSTLKIKKPMKKVTLIENFDRTDKLIKRLF